MQLQLESTGKNLITHCSAGSIAVNGRHFTGNLWVSATTIQEHWFGGRAEALSIDDLTPLLALERGRLPEILILGTGARHVFPSISLTSELHAEGVALEVMGTRAACRTYSVLVSEYRAVAAALLQIRAPGSTAGRSDTG